MRRQYGHATASAGRSGVSLGATGASHDGQAKVPVARTERTLRRSSRAPATLSERIGSAPSER